MATTFGVVDSTGPGQGHAISPAVGESARTGRDVRGPKQVGA